MPSITVNLTSRLERWFPQYKSVGPFLLTRESVAQREAKINAALTRGYGYIRQYGGTPTPPEDRAFEAKLVIAMSGAAMHEAAEIVDSAMVTP